MSIVVTAGVKSFDGLGKANCIFRSKSAFLEEKPDFAYFFLDFATIKVFNI